MTREKKKTDKGNEREVPKKREAPNPVLKTSKAQTVTEIKAHTRPCTATAAKTVTGGEIEKTVKSPTTVATKKNPKNGTVETMTDDGKKLIIARLMLLEERNAKISKGRVEEVETEKANQTVRRVGTTRETATRKDKAGKSGIVETLRRTTEERFLQTKDVTAIATEDSFSLQF